MEPEFWHERWIANQIGFHQNETNAYLKNYWTYLGPTTGNRILVPLCGKSLDMLWLCQQGYRVAGVEVSPLAVEAFFSENRLQPSIDQAPDYTRWSHAGVDLYCGDFFTLGSSTIGAVDGFYDRAALVAVDPSRRADYVAHLASLLPTAASGLLVTFDYDQQTMAGPPFAVQPTMVEQLFAADFHIKQLHTANTLATNPGFSERGLDWLSEHVFHLRRL